MRSGRCFGNGRDFATETNPNAGSVLVTSPNQEPAVGVRSAREGCQRNIHLETPGGPRIPIRRHLKIRAEAYDPKWEGYFEPREQLATAHEFRGPLWKLWRRQKGNCLVCRQQITSDTRWNVHHVALEAVRGFRPRR